MPLLVIPRIYLSRIKQNRLWRLDNMVPLPIVKAHIFKPQHCKLEKVKGVVWAAALRNNLAAVGAA